MRVLALEHDADDGAPESAGDRGDAFARLARDEAARLWDLVQEGVVRETYFRVERSAAVLVLECRDPTEAESVLATLPFVRAGLIRFELVGLRPYPGFARLFGPTTPPAP
jgi:muconolactone delta-isomerase